MLTDKEKFIVFVDNDVLEKSDAIILLEGDGFNRYRKAVDLYKNGFSDKIIFSGGVTDLDYGSYPFEEILPKILAEGIPKDAIIHESNSRNTYEQAIEVIKICIKNNWTKIILIATHDHQYRAYLTFLNQVLKNNEKIILFNAPVRNLGWFNETGWGIRVDRLNTEFKKINSYIEKGHIATFKQGIDYQQWKETKLKIKI